MGYIKYLMYFTTLIFLKMLNSRDVLVTTTSSLDGITIKQYLKPLSAHVVAGTNFFSDFFASFSDFFGGRSGSYQKQLSSLYNEAIEKLKIAAYEAGANCIVGLHIDLDEISGKNKSMFMLTAIGTAVIIEAHEKKQKVENSLKFDNVSSDKLQMLIKKNEVIEQAEQKKLEIDDNTWDFIIQNHVYEVYEYVVFKFKKSIEAYNENPNGYNDFRKKLVSYIDCLPDENKALLVHKTIAETDDEKLALRLTEIVGELQILDLQRIDDFLNSESFDKQKRVTRLLCYDKPFYNKSDIEYLKKILDRMNNIFVERGTRIMKKQLLSSKEKEMWTCECGKLNDIDSYCSNCFKDINGFSASDVSAKKAISFVNYKIELLDSLL
jgi:uncharacterized protein YbjQ (UPF0145 family)